MTGYLALVVLALLLSGAGSLFYSQRFSDEKVIHRKGYLRKNGTDKEATPAKVLVLTAAVGGGHEATGRTVQAELEKAGWSVTMADGLHEMSTTLSWFLNRVYCNQARNKPGSLGAIFAVTSRRAGASAVRFTTSLLFANRLLKVIREEKPGLIVSTYPLVTAALGHLRSRGRLRVLAAAVIADYGVHPLWVSPSADLHLVVSRRSAKLTEYAGGKAVVVRMPVAPAFYSAPARGEARRILGLPDEAFMVLVVGGAWGIGDLGGAARCASESGAYTIVVTGNNTELKARLEESLGTRDNVRILGWTKDMPVLMAAADCLIQNAGGMTCTEAIEVGLPIVVFDPIPGHGKFNALIMEKGGGPPGKRPGGASGPARVRCETRNLSARPEEGGRGASGLRSPGVPGGKWWRPATGAATASFGAAAGSGECVVARVSVVAGLRARGGGGGGEGVSRRRAGIRPFARRGFAGGEGDRPG